jgi:acetyl esterase/lipase
MALAAGLGALLSSACTLDNLNRIVPDGAYQSVRDLPYGAHPRQTLDIHWPKGTPPAEGWPVAVWIYGGSWESGDKWQYRFVAQTLAKLGWATVIPDYRVAPEVRFPAFVEDTALAVAWTQSQEGRATLEHAMGPIRKSRILMGHSAGAYNAAMVAYDPRWLRQAGGDPTAVTGFVGLAGPYDIHPYDVPLTKRLFGHETDPTRVEPMPHLGRDSPSSLLITGDDDDIVLPRHTHILTKAIRERTGDPNRATELTLPGAGHVGVLVGLTKILEKPRLTEALTRFFQARQEDP